MKAILAALAGGLLIGAVAASYAELPPPGPEEKAAAAAKAEKDAAAKAKAAKELAKAQDKAVVPGADHATVNPPVQDLTRKEAQTQMPTPGQANDHSSTGRETVPSGR